nr:hypothetical protein BaRGS_026891 [Batillaria attramentaria]
MAGLRELFEDDVIGKNGSPVPVESLAGNDLIGIYFSAHWCPPCRQFTPVLADYYNKVNASGKKFEVIFVSSDRDKASFDEYYSQMPWLTVGFGLADKRDALKGRYGIRGIPALVLVDSKGQEKSRDGRSLVQGDVTGEKYPWGLV